MSIIFTAYCMGVVLAGVMTAIMTYADRNVVRYWTEEEKFVMGFALAVVIFLSWFSVVGLAAYVALLNVKGGK